MKKLSIAAALLSICCAAFGQEVPTADAPDGTAVADVPGTREPSQKKDLVKTGLNLGPLPAIAYDADKGLQLGAILQLFNYGDGKAYPNYYSKAYLEFSYFTKGSMLIQARYDDKQLIPGVRWSSALRINLDKAYDFYGFNGYQSYYDYGQVAAGKAGDTFLFNPFYRFSKNEFLFKSDFIGDICGGLKWEAGIFANYFKAGPIDYANVNKGKSGQSAFPEAMPTLFEIYRKAGIISESESDGGLASGLRLGMVYDTRDKEGAPTRGIWAEGHVALAPKYLSETPYCRYSFTWRHYLPLVKNDVLTFAYRLNYEGTFGSSAPFYALPYMTVIGEKCDVEGMGGYNTVRGIMRTRVVGLDMATYNIELRSRFVKFLIGKQNIALGLSAFSDGTMATRLLDISALKGKTVKDFYPDAPVDSQLFGEDKDTPHITFGAGFRFIMNENFIVCAEYGMPLTHFLKNSPLYNQDGNGAFYINIGYLF